MSTPPAVVDHAVQTACSDPGRFAPLLDAIEPTVDAVGVMSRNVVAHYRAQAEALPASSRDDIGLRWVEAILATDQERHRGAPLTDERALGERVQGCCRDHTLLAVAALRHHGVPARSRVGFAPYLSPTWTHDHVVVEAWLGGRWQRFDPELAHLTDLGDDLITSARAWLGHRDGTLDISRFGAGEGIGVEGDWFVHSYVLVEVAHRFGDELLLWDTWGPMTNDLGAAPPADVALVDEVARLLVRADDGDLDAERALLDRYRADARLHPPRVIRSLSPHGGTVEVDLAARTVTRA